MGHLWALSFFTSSSGGGRGVLGQMALTLGGSHEESIGTEPKGGGTSLRVGQNKDRRETPVLILQPSRQC